MVGTLSTGLQATECLYYSYCQESAHFYGCVDPDGLKKKRHHSTYIRVQKRLFPYRPSQWMFMQPRLLKKNVEKLHASTYQAEDSIIFDASKSLLSLQGPSFIEYDGMKLEAHLIMLDVKNNIICAESVKNPDDKSISSPVFTYQDIQKDKYGKNISPIKRVFFMESMQYNLRTKRALASKLVTKQDDSIIHSNQVKQDQEKIFYGKDFLYTTCGLKDPHFYIRFKKAKVVQDQQITSSSFRFYFDKVPTPLGWFFGILFLEGKRKHGIITPDLGEEDSNGFYLRNGG